MDQDLGHRRAGQPEDPAVPVEVVVATLDQEGPTQPIKGGRVEKENRFRPA